MNDALYQLFHLPSLPIRLLLPEVVAYNVWIALPVPLCALGMYLFLRRHVSPPAAAFGAIAFAVSGPIVSTTNFPNLSWSVAAVPYVFWALERVFERRTRGGRAARGDRGVPGARGRAGDAGRDPGDRRGLRDVPGARWRDIRRGVLLVALGIAAGLLLAAIQYVPMVDAGRESMRSTMEPSDFWAFHPLALIELLVPHFFGDYFNSNLREMGWMLALNSERDPFYYTMYVGVPIVLLAAVAMLSGAARHAVLDDRHRRRARSPRWARIRRSTRRSRRWCRRCGRSASRSSTCRWRRSGWRRWRRWRSSGCSTARCRAARCASC